jgi:hypothetical protein
MSRDQGSHIRPVLTLQHLFEEALPISNQWPEVGGEKKSLCLCSGLQAASDERIFLPFWGRCADHICPAFQTFLTFLTHKIIELVADDDCEVFPTHAYLMAESSSKP